MRTHLSQKDMLDHIGKLQDRERQKITSIGLSNWLLFVTIGSLGYFLFPNVVLIQSNLSYTLLSYVLFLNVTLAIFDIFNSRFRKRKIIDFRKKTGVSILYNSQLILRDFEIILILIGLVVNIAAWIIFPKYFFVFIFFVHRNFSNLLVVVYYSSDWMPTAYRNFQKWVKENAQEEIVEPNPSIQSRTFDDRKYSRYSFILFFISISPFIYKFLLGSFIDINLKLNLYGFILVLITIMMQFLFVIFSKRMKIGWLESFEKEIIQDDLPASTIRAKLTKEYYNLSKIDDYF